MNSPPEDNNIRKMNEYLAPPPNPNVYSPTRQTSSPSKVPLFHDSTSSVSQEERVPLHKKVGNDPMQFSLWNPDTRTFRIPTKAEIKEIRNAFPTCIEMRFEFPLMVLRCSSPPSLIPLVVAGIPVLFLNATDEFEVVPGEVGNPRIQDPLSTPYDPKKESSWEFLERILEVLQTNFDGPLAAGIYLGKLVIELTNECTGEPAWNTDEFLQSRLNTPNEDVQDDTDYKSPGLTPGIRVAGTAHTGTGGIVIRNKHTGERRITVANHVFKDTNDVFHPITSDANHIGRIVERFPSIDLALVQLDDGVQYSNASYFEAPAPKRLVSSTFKNGRPDGNDWFFAETPYTGLVPILWCGVRIQVLPGGEERMLRDERKYIARSFGMNIGKLMDEVCGTPLVADFQTDEESDGVVLGFFALTDQDVAENVFIPVMDELVDAGWEIEV